MAEGRSERLQGTLELLVLRTLSLEPMHGWGIGQRIEQMSRELARERTEWERASAAVNRIPGWSGGAP